MQELIDAFAELIEYFASLGAGLHSITNNYEPEAPEEIQR